MSDLRSKQELNTGFSNAMGRGFEMALTPVVFGGIGWLIDRAAGTSPVFTIALAVFGVVGIGVRYWIGYDRDMKAEEGRLLSRGPMGPTVATPPPPAAGEPR